MKKLIISTLVAVMAFTAAAMPVSATDSQAGIEFGAGPLEPGGPGEVEGVVDNLNFYFGSQVISDKNEQYESVNNAEAPYNGKGKTVGYIVTNNSGSTTQGWELTVTISDFTQLVEGVEVPVMQGFTLDMKPDAGYPKASAQTSTTNNPAPSANTITLAAGSDEAETLFNAGIGEGRGTWGANWSGMLNVLGGTASAGEAQAIMTWNLQAA